VESLNLPRLVGGPLAKQKVIHVSLGTSHSACIDSTGKVYTWGAGWQGKLGLGSTDNQYTPQPVIALQFRSIRDVSCGAYHTMFITDDGDLYVCGRGDARLGLGETGDKLVPELNSFLRAESENVLVQACASEDHSMVITSKGAVWAWGKDLYGKLGLGASSNGLELDPSFSSGSARIESVPQLIESSSMMLGVPFDLDQDGGLSANGESSSNDQDGRAAFSMDIRSIASMSNHCIALAQDSTVFVWGSNGSGRLGRPPAVTHFFDSPRPSTHFFKRNEVAGGEKVTASGASAFSSSGMAIFSSYSTLLS
jgi:alpha-tubulin suppressor-like RCC1 family protein